MIVAVVLKTIMAGVVTVNTVAAAWVAAVAAKRGNFSARASAAAAPAPAPAAAPAVAA